MRFRRQLVVGYAAQLCFTLIAGGVAMVALHVSSERLERVGHGLANDLTAVQRLRFYAEQVVASSRGFLLTGDPESLERFRQSADRVNDTLREIEKRRNERAYEVDLVEATARTYVAEAQRAARQRSESGDPRQVLPFFEQTLMPARQEFDEAVQALVRTEQVQFERASQRALDLAAFSQTIVLVTTAVSLLLGLGLAIVSIRSLNTQYTRETAAKLAATRATRTRDELLAVVSHDLRNPLTAITMGAILLAEEGGNERQQKHVARISNAAARMQYLIDRLLDAEMLEQGKLELKRTPLVALDLVRDVVALFESRLVAQQVTLQIDCEPELRLSGDNERLLQVLSNFLSNAAKFTPEGGVISLSARRDGDAVVFEVTDSGPGIPAEQVPKLFDRYWQGSSRQRGAGLGLGLYISRQIIEAHGGTIGVRPSRSGGSTFWFSLQA